MQRLQAHMPQLKAIQAKYKDDKQRQQQEVMKFYQENKVNPFSSCLPLAAQLPVFISLFYMLRQSLRHDICPQLNPAHAAHTVPCGSTGHAGFLFIHDLTNTGTGVTLIVLLLLYVGTQLGSSVLTMLTSPQQMEKNQRIIMLVLPLLFVAFVVRFPTGLLVYWITTNLWTILQGYVMRRMLGPAPTAATAGVAGGTVMAATNGAPRDGATEGQGITGLLARSRAKASEVRTDKSDAKADKSDAKADKTDPKTTTAVAARPRQARGAPPPPPKKKKKRSGRRR
jgi:YidC/Oxa1 family membrane protein insertase